MSVLNRIACLQNRRDEVPNQELARELVQAKDRQGIQEIAANLWNRDSSIQADCIKVMYEIGCLDPSLIAGFVEDFIRLLDHRNNRLVWGAMIALSTVASLKADEIFARRQAILKAMKEGSVITVDNGVKTLALVAATNAACNRELFPFLLNHLQNCRPKDVPQHAEKTLPAVNAGNKTDFISVLGKRLADLQGGQITRLKKVIREAEKR